MKLYVAYGSNLNLAQMKKRCPNAKVVCAGLVKGYMLTFRGRSSGVANIEKAVGETVPVALWEISPSCEKELDVYEGYPTLYTKKDIEVITESGKKVKAMVYVMTKSYETMPAEPNPYYLNTIKQGYADNNLDVTHLAKAIKQVQQEIFNII